MAAQIGERRTGKRDRVRERESAKGRARRRAGDRTRNGWEQERWKRDIERGVGDERSEQEQEGERESVC